jgi:hypothetical protein
MRGFFGYFLYPNLLTMDCLVIWTTPEIVGETVFAIVLKKFITTQRLSVGEAV